MCREYEAVKNLISDTVTRDEKENDRIEEIKMISLRRLIEGGAAILAPVNRNHHKVIIGLIHIKPFVRKMLRVWVISYDILAKEKSAEDLNPCAIIIVKAPIKPHEELDNMPASIKPIWPTDE